MTRVRHTITGWAVVVVATALTPTTAGAYAATTPTCQGVRATVHAGAAGGELVGTAGRDVVVGGPGDDTVLGLGGDDLVCGRGGDDTLRGGRGRDVLLGGAGTDDVGGGSGADRVRGDAGPDRLRGGRGGDRLVGGPASDDCDPGPGDDTLLGCEDDEVPGATPTVPAAPVPPVPPADTSPTAVADTATVAVGAAATGIDVLANDTDPDGGPRSVAAVTQPAGGVVVLAEGALTYEPDVGFCTPATVTDDFDYVLAPGSSRATVSVTVTCPPVDPTAVPDTATIPMDAPPTGIDVLANDTDPDGGPRSVATTTQPTYGTVTLEPDGAGLAYEPRARFCTDGAATPDQFSYTLSPGGTSATVSVSVPCVSATISPTFASIASVPLGGSTVRTFTGSSTGPALTGRLRGGPLASAWVGGAYVAEGEQQERELVVPTGTTRLDAVVGNASNDGDVDLEVYNCTTGPCVRAAASLNDRSEERVSITDPAPGRWMVRLIGHFQPSGPTSVDYVDTLVVPGLGEVSVDDSDALRPAGSDWTAQATVTVDAAPSAGRVLRGTVEVVTRRGTVLASGIVQVDAVG